MEDVSCPLLRNCGSALASAVGAKFNTLAWTMPVRVCPRPLERMQELP